MAANALNKNNTDITVAGHIRVQNGIWQMSFSWKNPDGTRSRKEQSTGLKEKGNKKRAEAMLEQTKAEITSYLKTQRQCKYHGAEHAEMLFADYMSEWVAKTKYSIEIKTNYILPYFSRYPVKLNEIDEDDIETFYAYLVNKRNLSNNTVIRLHSSIRKALQDAYRRHWITHNPADLANKPKQQPYIAKFYNMEELSALFRAVKGHKLELAVILAGYYGMRRSEVLGMKWEHIDFVQKTLSIRHTVVPVSIDGKTEFISKDRAKNKSSLRTLPLVPPFEEFLYRKKTEIERNQKLCGACYHQDYLEYIYVDEIGKLVNPHYISDAFPRFLKQNGMRPIRFHDLRHTCASVLYASGVDMRQIQAWLGHSTIKTTEMYTHLLPDSLVKSAEAILPVLEEKKSLKTTPSSTFTGF